MEIRTRVREGSDGEIIFRLPGALAVLLEKAEPEVREGMEKIIRRTLEGLNIAIELSITVPPPLDAVMLAEFFTRIDAVTTSVMLAGIELIAFSLPREDNDEGQATDVQIPDAFHDAFWNQRLDPQI